VSRALPRTARPLAVVVPLALVLTGCGAGFDAQTYQQRTIADVSNTAVGAIAVRAVSVQPGPGDGLIEAGQDAVVTFTLVNDGAEDDRLLEITAAGAGTVDLVERGSDEPLEGIEVRALGTTGDLYGAVLRSIDEPLRPGEYVELTLRFERNGEVTVPAPVAVTGEYDEDRERSENFHLPGEHSEEGSAEEGEGLADAAEEETGSERSGEQ
jgi:copper(I)-binding protein